MSLLWNSKKNKDILADPTVKKLHKDKIRKIETYKKYFYDYFGLESSDIYSQTTFLKQEAVTYLVIRSKFNQIKAEEECFPIVGCFPYLGFFSMDSAKMYQQKWDKTNNYTYLRSVYAYSTLGNFEDRILSSFFYYDDYDLAELIFHELFHTIFFISDQVELNENLANFFGKELVKVFFTKNDDLLKIKKNNQVQNRKLAKKLSALVLTYAALLKSELPKSKKQSDLLLISFLSSTFMPRVKKYCKQENILNCYPLKGQWNNASFAAFATYEVKQDEIKKLFKKNEANLKKFYNYLMSQLNKYKKLQKSDTFSKYLLGD